MRDASDVVAMGPDALDAFAATNGPAIVSTTPSTRQPASTTSNAPAPHKYAQCVSICPDYVRRVLSIVTNWANAAAPHALDAFEQYRDALGVVSMLHDASDVVAMLHDALDVVAVVRHALGVVATLCNALGVPAA